VSEKAAGDDEDVFVVFVKFVFPLGKTYLAGREVALRDVQFLDPGIKSRWRDLKLGCSSVGTVDATSEES
jgi:hypothetical protein